MYITSSIADLFEDFTLDTASIGNISTSKTRIVLPYSGPLPANLSNTTGAAIIITFQVGLTVNVLLVVERDGQKYRHPVKATAEEIDRILQPFFFGTDGKTRRDNGLERYSLGLCQGSYVNWKRLTLDKYGLDNLLSQLSPASIERVLQHIKHSKTA